MFSLAINLFQGVLDALGRLLLAEVIEHQSTAHQQGRRIGESLAGDVGSGTVNSLEHRAFVADVGAGHHAEAPDKARGQVAHDVAIKIRQQKHVKLQGIHHDLHAGVVNDKFLVFDGGEICRHRAH